MSSHSTSTVTDAGIPFRTAVANAAAAFGAAYAGSGSGSGSAGSYSAVPKEEEEDYDDESSDLEKNLAGPDPSKPLPAATSVPMLQVVAPATLPEGYEFQAVSGKQNFTVKVPPGGIEKGQKFVVPFPEPLETTVSGIRIPVGKWRDGLFCSLFNYGICHPHCWTACCCPLLAAGQVISRLKLTAWGGPGSAAQAARAFRVILATVVLFFTIDYVLGVLISHLDPDPNTDLLDAYLPVDAPASCVVLSMIRTTLRFTYGIVTWVLLTDLRTYVRQKYGIPRGRYGRVDDCCCAFFCAPCVAGQLLRHTTDYDVYPATCCTERGISPHAPSIV